MSITPEEISELKTLAKDIIATYSTRDAMALRYQEIYFMDNAERPKGLDVDSKDIKTTISASGRNDVTGLKRILDTGEIQIKVKTGNGNNPKAEKIENGLRAMLRVSSESRLASVEKDENLAAILFGMSVLTVESVDDLIAAKTKDGAGKERAGVNRYVLRQLQELKKRTPFLIGSINPTQSYPEWGEYGLVGHVRKYSVRGHTLRERWGCADAGVKNETAYTVYDFFHYDKRVVWAEGVSVPLFADNWTDLQDDEITQLPIFVRYGGGTSLWMEPERQLHPFLYAKAKGEWDKRENLYWTYLFTSVFMQGLPGPTLVRDPDDTSDVVIRYDQGVKIITARGRMENINVIDGDVLQLKALMDNENARSTIRPEAFGGGAEGATFSGYVTSMNASKLPAEDPKEGISKVYRDMCLYILKRIKAEGIENELIAPTDIPDDVEIEVVLEPNLTQDDLRNAQIVASLKTAQVNVSDEWLNTNILKIPDSAAMFKQKTKEDIRRALIGQMLANPELMKPLLMTVMGQTQQPQPQQPQPGQSAPEQGMGDEMGGQMAPQMMGGEMPPQTDAMIPQEERL